jgi:xanthine dehydrogenase accessory factor
MTDRWWNAMHTFLANGRPFCLITVVASKGSVPRHPGARMLVDVSGTSWGTIGGGRLEMLAMQKVPEVLKRGEILPLSLALGPQLGQCCGGKVDLMLEPLNVHPMLFIVGAGHVGQALASILATTSFQVCLIDERPGWLESLLLAPTLTGQPWQAIDFSPDSGTLSRCYVVIMSHSHELDSRWLERCLPLPLAFLGMIGSHSKWKSIRKRLEIKGYNSTQLDRVVCPVGRRWPADSPQEIALSIACSLLDAYYQTRIQSGNPLGNPSGKP